MQVKEVMTTRPTYLSADASIKEVADTMRQYNTGFEPLNDGNKVVGVVTDRDIAVRAVAAGKDPNEKAKTIATEKVLYAFEDDDIEDVVQNMVEQQVQRLLVLNNPKNKDLVGVVTLGDIADHTEDGPMAKKVINAARHYH